MEITIIDDFLLQPYCTLEAAQARSFSSITVGLITFHGISMAGLETVMPRKIAEQFPGALPTMSLFRQSPGGQVEPNFIHSDCEMGDWTAILYLNEHPAEGDGTDFWFNEKFKSKGTAIPGDLLEEGKSLDGWTRLRHVEAKFNRLLVFRSWLFHSRAIFENYGQGDDARLTQVTFGRFA